MGKPWKIVLAGEGGQGVQSVAGILADAANDQGREALYIPNFGVEQRGGVSVAYLQIGDEPVGAPKFQTADIIIALSDRAVTRTTRYTGPDTVFVYDSGIENLKDEDLPTGVKKILAIPALDAAKRELHPRVFNVIIMGAVIKATGVVPEEKAKEALEKKLGYKFEQKPELRDMNFKAIERGAELVAEAL
ncbi:MAG: 2-oxoacid:acceptor oxidoreductase family protein [Clostridiales bacterium]|nr:2-oxoacid:acceptor oxidoreductase family protein [Clostridiales bacterium]MCF8021533.1 2-oxoacid:acceptor oxidoreductase family protein [Clostridiales bacterium]